MGDGYLQSALHRVSLTIILTATVAWTTLGCRGQSLEGAWRGPFPLAEAEDCRVRLLPARSFDLACRGHNEWVGLGRFRPEGDTLRFEFMKLARRKAPVDRLPDPIVLRFVGRGNEMDIYDGPDDRQPVTWRRSLER